MNTFNSFADSSKLRLKELERVDDAPFNSFADSSTNNAGARVAVGAH